MTLCKDFCSFLIQLTYHAVMIHIYIYTYMQYIHTYIQTCGEKWKRFVVHHKIHKKTKIKNQPTMSDTCLLHPMKKHKVHWIIDRFTFCVNLLVQLARFDPRPDISQNRLENPPCYSLLTGWNMQIQIGVLWGERGCGHGQGLAWQKNKAGVFLSGPSNISSLKERQRKSVKASGEHTNTKGAINKIISQLVVGLRCVDTKTNRLPARSQQPLVQWALDIHCANKNISPIYRHHLPF